MTDLPSSIGIEAVELLSEGGRSVTVRVTGRWRRRRAELRGQAMLVVEGAGGRQRFLALPEPPWLTGAAPGTWRMSFSLPAALAPQLPGRTFLQIGGVMVPLPIGDVEVAAESAPGREGPDTGLLEARRARSSELAAESARRRAAELAARIEELERELDEARADSARLRDTVAQRERRLRAAEQHTHAERALRTEVERELARLTRAAQHDLGALHERVADLERELRRLRRAVDEAEHLATVAQAARVDAERRLAERPVTGPAPPAPPPPPASAPQAAPQPAPAPEPPPAAAPDSVRAERAQRELELSQAVHARPPRAAPPPVAERPSDRLALGLETAMARRRSERWDARVAALERELAAAREEAEVQRRRSARAYEAIELVRGELRQLHEAGLPVAPVAPAAPAAPSPPPAAGPAAPSPPPAAAPVQAEQLSAALARLREQARAAPDREEAPAPEPAPAPRATKPWLGNVFRTLADREPSGAGRLLLGLLPAQRLADPHPVAYDLVLSDVLCAHVTVDSAMTHVDVDATIRPLSEVDFRVVGDLAGVARLLTAGPVGRRLLRAIPGRRVARVWGERRRLAAVDRLIGARLTIGELHSAGVRLDPVLAMGVAGLAIEPAWTAGERFTLAHREPHAAAPDAYLNIRDGKPPLASAEAPHGPVASVLICPAGELLGALGAAAAADVAGEERPVALLRQWLDRAQSG